MANPQRKPWNMLAYIAGDNSLSEFALVDVKEMCVAGASQNLSIGVQVDTEGDFDGLVRYDITPRDFTGEGHRTVIERLPEADTGSPKCLASFLKYGLARYPADNRLAVVWSHGSGFKTVRRDAGFDDTSGNSMDMNEITSALTKGGINKKKKLSIIGFDACLMAMLEVANHFINHAEILVGSQQTEPGDGWPYDKVVALMNSNPDKVKLSKGIVNEYVTHYRNYRESGITQAAINVQETADAVRALSALGKWLHDNLDNNYTELNHLRIQSQNYEYADYIDGIDFAQKLKAHFNAPALATLCDNFIAAMKKCIIHSDYYGVGVEDSNGLSIWFPVTRDQYVASRAKYMKLHCNRRGSGWVNFLDTYYSR